MFFIFLSMIICFDIHPRADKKVVVTILTSKQIDYYAIIGTSYVLVPRKQTLYRDLTLQVVSFIVACAVSPFAISAYYLFNSRPHSGMLINNKYAKSSETIPQATTNHPISRSGNGNNV